MKGLLLVGKSRNLRMFVKSFFLPGFSAPPYRYPFPVLWYLPFQNPNSPRRSKSLKHKNGKWGGTMGVILTMSSKFVAGGWRWRGRGIMGGPVIPFYHPHFLSGYFQGSLSVPLHQTPFPFFFFSQGT